MASRLIASLDRVDFSRSVVSRRHRLSQANVRSTTHRLGRFITMSGIAVAYGSPVCGASASRVFELCQQIEVSFDKPTVKAAKLTAEGRLIGFLRSHKVGSADVCASATVVGAGPVLSLAMPGHSVSGCESASINDREAPTASSSPRASAT